MRCFYIWVLLIKLQIAKIKSLDHCCLVTTSGLGTEFMHRANPLLKNIPTKNDIEGAIALLDIEKNIEIIEMINAFVQSDSSKMDLSELELKYGHLDGYMKCANRMSMIGDNEYAEISKILHALYSSIKSRIVFLQSQTSTELKEKNGLKALIELVDRNINEHGSGSDVVKRLLLGLQYGQSYSFDLTTLRMLDDENFRDVIAVLQMNARPSASKHLHQYFDNGEELWSYMKKTIV